LDSKNQPVSRNVAEALINVGECENAIKLLDEALAFVQKTGSAFIYLKL
jgi:hypothetical protein